MLSSRATPRVPNDLDWGLVIVNTNLTGYSPRCCLRRRSLFKESVKLADAEFGRYSNVPVFTIGHNQTV